MTKVGILGAGLSGLTLANYLKRDFEILERGPIYGGLCRSYSKDGFIFDLGGHILYSRDSGIMNQFKDLLNGNVLSHKCGDYIWYDKATLIPYPFEQSLYKLPKTEIVDCVKDFLFNENANKSVSNMKEWVYKVFGRSIAEKYLLRYNEKVWKVPIDLMSIEWVQRVPQPTADDILRSAIGLKTIGGFERKQFYYPLFGGIQTLVDKLAEPVKNRVICEFTISSIKKRGETWFVSNGKVERPYGRLVSTISIIELVKLLDDVPTSVTNACSKLQYNSVIIAMIGFNGKTKRGTTALYFPQKDVPFHRLCFPRSFSANCVPQGKGSVLAEISFNSANNNWSAQSDEEIISKVVDSLDKIDLVNPNSVILSHVEKLQYGYVVYDLSYRKNISVVRDYLQEKGINILGRFGEFEYLNMDQCFQRGVKCAQEINNP